jgi:hypothetical protein
MGMAPVAHVVWNKFMTFNPKNPDWLNRDRFVLSYVFSPLFRMIWLRKLCEWLVADSGARDLAPPGKAQRVFPRCFGAVELAWLVLTGAA